MSDVVLQSRLTRAAMVAALALTAACGGAAARQEEETPQQLTVALAVCPAGATGAELAACEERLARDYEVSVRDAANTAVADDVAPDAAGVTTIGLEQGPPGELRVVVNTAVDVGTRAIACEADGAPLEASPAGSGAAIPVFDVTAETTADISCVVDLYGFPQDDELLDIVPSAAGEALTGLAPAATPVAVAAGLPATGAGPGSDSDTLLTAIAALGAIAAVLTWQELRRPGRRGAADD